MRLAFMTMAALLAASLAATSHAAENTVSAGGVTLRSVSVELPFGTQIYQGSHEAEVMTANCLSCHSAEMISAQPALGEAAWKAEVLKMRAVYKAPLDDADVPTIVAYLMSIKGAK